MPDPDYSASAKLALDDAIDTDVMIAALRQELACVDSMIADCEILLAQSDDVRSELVRKLTQLGVLARS